LFTGPENAKARASQADFSFANTDHALVTSRHNAATDAAALIIPAVGNTKLRHETLQHFMLANDSATVAVEVPVWMNGEDIRAVERQ
jgi:hypothetical protein